MVNVRIGVYAFCASCRIIATERIRKSLVRLGSLPIPLSPLHSSSTMTITRRISPRRHATPSHNREISTDPDLETNSAVVPDMNRSIGLKRINSTSIDIELLPKKFPLLLSWMNHNDVTFHYLSDEEAKQIRSHLLKWYRQNRRKLPWRGDPPPWNGSTAAVKKKNAKDSSLDLNCATASHLQQTYPVSPYGVWVSEVMLQQTRVEAVIEKWCQWMTRFPTVEALSNATVEDINAIWAGLGYYRRAQLLLKASQVIVSQYDGVIPSTVSELMQLPGIGCYTAGAIASIAYGQAVPVVDGNVCRVLSRLRGIAQTIKAASMKDKYAWVIAEQIVAAGDGTCAGEVNQAMMELGATYCAPSGTGIDPNDPLVHFYWSTKLGREMYQYQTQESLLNASTPLSDLLQHRIVSHDGGCLLCDAMGVSDVMTQFRSNLLTEAPSTSLKESGQDDDIMVAQRLCHSLFPLTPPKLHKKEDLYVVAAIYNSHSGKWMLVKRPDDNGLLSGQWEFPSFCVWQSETNKPTKSITARKSGPRRAVARPDMSHMVPSISIANRRKYLRDMLKDRMCETGFVLKLSDFATVSDSPIVHVFSHVRHTMYIEYATYESLDSEMIGDNSESGVQQQWMSVSDMKEVGITSGVQKILKAVLDFIKDSKDRKTKKKRRTIADHFQQDS